MMDRESIATLWPHAAIVDKLKSCAAELSQIPGIGMICVTVTGACMTADGSPRVDLMGVGLTRESMTPEDMEVFLRGVRAVMLAALRNAGSDHLPRGNEA